MNMANNKIKYFILTGDPGVGKTTLVVKITSILSKKGIATTGFYTEEVRNRGVREGFDVVTLDGHRGRLARDQALLENHVKHKVGKYGVLISEFEKIALPCLVQPTEPTHLLVVDEIGKMEFFSEVFKSRIRELFSPSSACYVLATIPVKKGDAIIESIRNNSSSKVWLITRENRSNISEDILSQMKTTMNFN